MASRNTGRPKTDNYPSVGEFMALFDAVSQFKDRPTKPSEPPRD